MLRQLVGMSAHRIGQLRGPIDQHSAAIASHAAASGQKIKKGFPQVFGRSVIVMSGCVPWCQWLFQAVSNGVKQTSH